MAIDSKKDKIKKNSWVFVLIIWFKEFVGKKPPADITVIDRFNPLNKRTSDIEKNRNIKKVKDV